MTLTEAKQAGRLAIKGQPKKCDASVTLKPTLKDVGLSRKDSQRAQMVADNKNLIPDNYYPNGY